MAGQLKNAVIPLNNVEEVELWDKVINKAKEQYINGSSLSKILWDKYVKGEIEIN